MTRLDIAYAIRKLSQAINQQFMSHWISLKRPLFVVFMLRRHLINTYFHILNNNGGCWLILFSHTMIQSHNKRMNNLQYDHIKLCPQLYIYRIPCKLISV